MRKRKSKAEKLIEAAIDRACRRATVNVQIPIMEIPKIYAKAEFAANQGGSEEQIYQAAAAYVETIKIKESA